LALSKIYYTRKKVLAIGSDDGIINPMSKNLPRFLEPKIRFMIVVHLQRCFKKTKWFGKNARAKGDRRERGEEEG
jgi:hypothetical protein